MPTTKTSFGSSLSASTSAEGSVRAKLTFSRHQDARLHRHGHHTRWKGARPLRRRYQQVSSRGVSPPRPPSPSTPNSPSTASTAYVMCKTGLSHEDAFTFVQSRRFCVAPRTEFQHQLEVSVTETNDRRGCC